MKAVAAGMTHREEVVAGPEHLASAVGNRGVHVVSSPATILFIEMACHRAIDGYLEPHEASVGVHFELAHRAAAVPGEPLEVAVELIHRSERDRLRFRAKVTQRGVTIMDGEHHRAVVELARLLRQTEPQVPPLWEFWLDFQSPWSGLMVSRAVQLAANCGADLQYRPVGPGTSDSNLSAARRTWMRQDLLDHAELAGVALKLDLQHPPTGIEPQLACLYAASVGRAAEFVPAIVDACWVQGRDICNRETIASIASDCDLDPIATVDAIGTDRFTDLLVDNRKAADAAGIFELPTIQFGRKRYCGYHRLDLLVSHTLASLQAGASS